MRFLNNRGDTIVEVLIAIIVVATVMASSYAVAIRSQKVNQQSQEHSQALEELEAQLEQLKAHVNDNGDAGLSKFCFDRVGGLVTSGFAAGVPAASSSGDDFSGYPSGCKRRTVANTTCTANSICFHIAVVKGANNTYTATARWDGVNARDEVKLLYRVNP